MSIIFLDDLPLVRVDTFLMRLSDLPLYETGFSNASLVNLTNINGTNAIIPGPVGTLPLDQFIYYIIGAIIIIILCGGIWYLFRAIIYPKEYHHETISWGIWEDPGPSDPFSNRKIASQTTINIAKDEVKNWRAQTRYFYNGSVGTQVSKKQNLPLPVGGGLLDLDEPDYEITPEEISTWEDLIKEEAKLNTIIANLQRIASAQHQAGETGMINPKLQAALKRRAEVVTAVNASYERFRQRREEWSEEEWQVIMLIMEHYSRRPTS